MISHRRIMMDILRLHRCPLSDSDGRKNVEVICSETKQFFLSSNVE